jgi:diaminopimelate decarboxylase
VSGSARTAVAGGPPQASVRALLPDGVPARRRDVLLRAAAEHRLGLVGDLDALEARYAVAAAAAAEHDVELLCAVKASTRPEVLNLALEYGLGLDIANAREYAHARAAAAATGHEPTLSLTSPALPTDERAELYAAFRDGSIARWHCDSLAQLAELAEHCPGRTVGIRVNLDGLDIPAGMPLWQPSRFGIHLDELPAARRIAAERGCRLGWLHTHNASEVNDTASFVFAARQIVAAAAAHGLDLEAVDLGGGVLGPPTSDALAEFFAAVRGAAGAGVGVVLEPGRFWLTDCISLVTQVLEVKYVGEHAYVVLDMGTMNHLQWSDTFRIPTLAQLASGPGAPDRRWRICGRSCFEEDWLDEEEVVPVAPGGAVPEPGDYLVLGNISGYSVELACEFNGLDRASLDLVRP